MAVAACTPGGGPPPLDFTSVRPPGQLEGAWVGGTNALGGYILLETDFRRADGRISGEIRAPSENVSRLPVTEAEAAGTDMRFSFRSPLGMHRATGRWDGGMIFGRIEGGGLSGDFHLLPLRASDPAVSRRRAGSYAERSDHHLLVMRRANGGLAWAETEPLDDGAVWIAGGTMYSYTADTVFTDRSIRAEPRVHEWAVFGPDGAIEWHPETRPVRVTPRTDRQAVQEEVEFASNEIELAGTLVLPPGQGPHPAVVHVHGSGPVERTNLLSMLRADLLLRDGIAVLLYDKRGVAGSSGDWEQAGIEDLAGDAAAGVALLRDHPAIDPEAVGVLGHSQGGWIAPAAARRTDADFLVVLSGGGVSPSEQEVFRARTEAEAAGLSAHDAARLMELKWRYAATGEGWDEYLDAVGEADPGVVALVEAPTDQDPARWALTRRLAVYDPLPDLRAVRVPTVVVFGADDDNVPVARAAALWRETVPASSLTIETVSGVGHALVDLREELGSIFPAALVQTLEAWVDARVWSRGEP